MEESLHYSLMKTHTMLNRRILSGAQAIGLTPGQPKILECLSRQEGIDQKTIAEYCEIEPATVGRILLRMEQAGLIERRHREGNRRSLFVFLTDKGRQTAKNLETVFESADNAARSGLTDEEYEQLFTLLEKMRTALNQNTKGGDSNA